MLSPGNESLLRKISAVIFAGFFLYNFAILALKNPEADLLHEPISILIGWPIILILPLWAAFRMFQNRRSGINIVRIYVVFILACSVLELLAPGCSASEPITEQQRSESFSHALLTGVLMVFIALFGFAGKREDIPDKSE